MFSMKEKAFGKDEVGVGVQIGVEDEAHYHAHWTIRKYLGDFPGMTDEEIAKAGIKPYEVLEIDGNCLLNGGINNIIWAACKSALSNFIDTTHGCIGVGDSSTAAAATQTGLQASANYYWVVATSVTVGSSQQIVIAASFSTTQANYAWNEICAGIAPSGLPGASANPPGSGTALNRLVSSMGTKTSAGTWTATLTVTLS